MRHKNGHEDRAVITTSYRRDLKLLTYSSTELGINKEALDLVPVYF